MFRRRIQFFGRVQGVGFRHTCLQVSHRHRVTGWVRNMPDGSVLMVLEGNRSDLDRYLADLEEVIANHPFAYIDRINRDEEPCGQPEFSSFEVRRE